MERKYSDEVIGANMRMLRKRERWSQTRIAEVLTVYTGRRWHQQQVSHAEAGEHRFTVVELFVLGLIFKVSPLRILRTGRDDVFLQFGTFGVPETRLLEDWITSPRGRLNPDELQTAWPEAADWDRPARRFFAGKDPFEDGLDERTRMRPLYEAADEMELFHEIYGEDNGDD